MTTTLAHRLGLRAPIVCAPLFLISNVEMMVAAAEAGILGGIPALNYRTSAEFESALVAIRQQTDGPIAVNLICKRAYNPRLDADLALCLKYKVAAIITAFSSPRDVIDQAHAGGALVFHDAIKLEHAHKAVDAGADAIIAVSGGAGGHAGTLSPMVMWPWFKAELGVPIIAAGGIATGAGIAAALALGAELAYLGTRFIATMEAGAPEGHKHMIQQSGPEDIVYSNEVSGVQANWMRPSLDQFRESVDDGNPLSRWRQVYSAGHVVGLIDDRPTIAQLVSRLIAEYETTRAALPTLS